MWSILKDYRSKSIELTGLKKGNVVLKNDQLNRLIGEKKIKRLTEAVDFLI